MHIRLAQESDLQAYRDLLQRTYSDACVDESLCIIYAHNKKVIDMYKRWGFEIDTSKGDNGYFYRHWEEWPPGVQLKSVYMRLKR